MFYINTLKRIDAYLLCRKHLDEEFLVLWGILACHRQQPQQLYFSIPKLVHGITHYSK